MPIAQRQSSLFVAEDWRVFYRAFTEINFSAYDFDTIRTAMVDHIRRNFPEDFNDWIESSEFIAIIELLAYLGQSLAFRVDLNTRENFLDTAERRESILKLARFLSYAPTRNQAATGLIKITQITTNENIFDSNGLNLSNRSIQWNDPNNPDWFEQFILVLNNVFNSSNPFGRPLKAGIVNNINTQLFALNNVPNFNGVFKFSSQINNEVLPFEAVNANFNDGESFFEREPDPLESFHMLYRNDGEGNASPDTGFFFMFKQGVLGNQDFTIDTPIENRVIQINETNINNDDVFVQEIDQNGFIIQAWTKVPTIVGNNVIFNSIEKNERNIFSVITRENDQISLRFADGRFGNAPSGFFRVWTRQSANNRFQIKTSDMSNVPITISYVAGNNNTFKAKFILSLQNTVTNSSPSETNASIKRNAPQIFHTQDRMVNGEDYNIFPLQNPEAARVKSVNRIHSGFSRFIDINDPTGKSQDVNLFAEDGSFYVNEDIELRELALPTNLTDAQIASTIIQPLATELERRHFFYFFYPKLTDATLTNLEWVESTADINSTTGFFSEDGVAAIVVGDALDGEVNPRFFVNEGALIEFDKAGWVSVISIATDSTTILASGDGPIRLAEPVKSTDTVLRVISQFRTTFQTDELNAMEIEISFKNNFGLRFDAETDSWIIISGADIDMAKPFSFTNAGDETGLNLDSSWLIRAEFSQTSWRFFARTFEFIFESEKQIRFFFDEANRVVDVNTGTVADDFIKVLKINPQFDADTTTTPGEVDFMELSPVAGFKNDIIINVFDVFREEDGFVDPRRLKLTFTDTDEDGVPDDPTLFETVTKIDSTTLFLTLADVVIDETELFFELFTNNDGFKEKRPTDKILAAFNDAILAPTNKISIDLLTSGSIINGNVIYIRDVKEFRIYDNVADSFSVIDAAFEYRRGRKDLFFQWKRFAPPKNRIDPAITNIIDNFVLTVGYDTLIRQWIDNGGASDEMPEPPTTEDLKLLFNEVEEKKMLSDQIVWHSVKYKVLFGDQAIEELRATFKITKVPGTEISDGEIKSKTVNTINEFFGINNFDFGETFYFTELAAFIHQRLATIIGSIVIVPLNEESRFGDLFQVRSEADEIFISSAKVSDIQIVDAFNDNVLRVRN